MHGSVLTKKGFSLQWRALGWLAFLDCWALAGKC
jgi:hypothetical protein